MNDSNEVFENSGIEYEEPSARQHNRRSHRAETQDGGDDNDAGHDPTSRGGQSRGDQSQDERQGQAGHEQAGHASGAYNMSQPEPIRPTGISWVTVLLGIACLVLAGTVLTVQLSDLRVAWNVATPAIVVGAGVLLLLAGAAGVVRGRSDEDLSLD
ncbi:MAG: hypothetical protein WA991_15835 [Ornithinimicrobium sp.]